MTLSPWTRRHVNLDYQTVIKTYYGSDISVSSGKNSNDSSVKIVYEVINLTASNSDNRNNQEVTLRFKK